MILKTLAWRELALRFLDSHNPQPERAIVVAHAIVEFDCRLIPEGRPLRHHAHDFVITAVRFIEFGQRKEQKSIIMDWLAQWSDSNSWV